MDTQHRSAQGSVFSPKSPDDGPARISSQALLGAQRELLIVHNGREYRLRVTQNGKLILTA